MLPSVAQAQSVWGGAGSTTFTNNYNLGTNWSNPPAGAPPVAGGQSAEFANTGNSSVVVTIGPIAPDSWTFDANSQSYTVTGALVNFGTTTGLVNNANAGQAITITAPIGGVGAKLQQLGASTLTLSANSIYTGATTISAGTLKAGSVGGLSGNSAFTVNSTLDLNGFNSTIGSLAGSASGIVTNGGAANATLTAGGDNTSTTFAGVIQDGGTNKTGLTKVGTGTLTVSGTNTYTGGTNVNAGTLSVTGSITSNVTNNATFTNSGTVTGNANNAGAVTNSGTWATSTGFSNSGTLTQAAGTISGGLTNTGTVNASGGAINGVIVNGAFGFFNVTGTVTSDSTFNNSTINSLLVVSGTGNYTVTGLLTNSGANGIWCRACGGGITVASGGSLIANGGITNNAAAVIVNSGTITGAIYNADLTNRATGLILNIGTWNGDLISNLNNASGAINNSGTWNGNANNAGAVINSGTWATSTGFINSGTLTQAAGTIGGGLANTGTVNASGGAINGVIVNGAAGQFNVTGTVTSDSTFNNSAASSTLTVNSGTYTIGALLSNSGVILVKNGGTLAVTVGGVTNKSGGTLTVNAGGTVNGDLNNAGTLTGSGTVVGNTTIATGGTFAAGNGMAGSSMAVNGNLAFQSGAQYLVKLNPTTASFANVTGASTLAGAVVDIFTNGTYVSKKYMLLSSAGGVSGTFNSLINTNLPSGFKASLSYDPTHAYLDLTLNFTGPSFGAGLNGNQQNVANAVTNFFNATGSIPAAFGALTPAGLTQASGEFATGTQQTTFEAMTQFLNLLLDPFLGGRGDMPATTSGHAQFADEGDNANADASTGRKRSGPERDAYGMITKAVPRNNLYDPHWSIWAAAFGGSETTSGNAMFGSDATTSRIYGAAAGADYLLSPRTIAGFSLAGGGTNFSVANSGTGRSDLFQAGAFVRHTVGAAYVAGALAYGWQDVTTNRIVTVAGIDQLQARFNANAFSGRLEGGYRLVTPWMGITPYAAGQFTTYDLPAYAEQVLTGANTFALNYASKSVTASRSELGVRTDKSYALTDAVLTLRSRFAWAHDFNTDTSIAPTFQTLPGASFVVNGAAQAQNAALTMLAAELKWRNGFSLAGTFEGAFSSTTTGYAGKGVVRYQW